MLTDKNLGIKKFIFNRLDQIDDEIINADPEYIQLMERPDELLKLVATKLSPEDNELLQEYNDFWYRRIIRREELIYTEALMDGIMIGYWAAVISRGVEKIKV